MNGKASGKDSARRTASAGHGDPNSDDAISMDDTVAPDDAVSMDDTVTPDDAISMDDTVTPDDAISTDATMAPTGRGHAALSNLAAELEGGVARAHGVSRAADLDELPTVDPALYARGAEIARGGMGRIVQARDRKLGRDLAIKELLARTPTLEKRFEREMKITARLQHPAIIAVHDAGRWPSGEAFYTMKHVAGKAFDKVIAESGGLRERLALLPTVLALADALAYAHAEGVIHRDLKPGNILVGSFGETVVIDWGLAKELDDTSPDETLDADLTSSAEAGLTVLGEAMGTPAYMPPEQAEGQVVDQRADVYAIGAILYHLLSGEMPYADTKPKSAHELLFTVAEQAPTELGETAKDIPPDLLTIVTKAMAREASERYPSAGELADDLRRYQTGQLVGAHQYSSWALVKRWVGQHRAAVGVAVVMAVILAAGGAVSFSRIANQRDRAEANQLEVENLLGFMLGDLNSRLKPIGKSELLELVAEKAAAYFAKRPVDWSRPEAAYQRNLAHKNLGDVLKDQGDLGGALLEYRASRSIAVRMTKEDSRSTRWQQALIESHIAVGDVLHAKGDLPGALAEYRAAEVAARRLLEVDVDKRYGEYDLAVAMQKVGDVLAEQGDLANALAAYRGSAEIIAQIVAINPGNADMRQALASCHDKTGDALVEHGDIAGALAEYRATKTGMQRLVDKDPHNTFWQRGLAVGHIKVGDILNAQSEHSGALLEYRAGKTILERLSELDPQNTTWQQILSAVYERISVVLNAQGDSDAARTESLAARTILERLIAKDPKNTVWQRGLSINHLTVGAIMVQLDKVTEALTEFRASKEITERLLELDPQNSLWQRDLLVAYDNIGNALKDQGNLQGALVEFRASTAFAERLVQLDPQNAGRRRDLAVSHMTIAGVLQRAGEAKAARDHLAQSAALYQNLAELPADFYNAACVQALSGNSDKAFAMLDQAIAKGWHEAAHMQQDASLASLRKDPRWQPLIDKMKANE